MVCPWPGFRPAFLTKERCLSLLVGLWLLFALSPSLIAASVIFGREELFTLNSGNISALKNSGFTTVILFVVDVAANGDLNYNGDHLIITNGTYIGDSGWPSRLAALRTAPTSIMRIEVCTGGAGAQSWNNIKNLIASQGTGPGSILYRNFQTLKNTLGIDAICNDDEAAFDASSAAVFNNMITALGMKNTLCPYNNVSYWQSVFNNSTVDAIYLQCYDGGAGNDPGTWNGYFGGFKVAPGDWNNDSVATIESKFTAWAPVINGGFMWQLELIGDANLASYATVINRAVDPLMVTPATGFSAVTAYHLRSLPASTPFVLSNTSAGAISWSVINTSTWLTVSATLGTNASGVSTNVTVSLNPAIATNLALDNYSASVVFSNKTTRVGITRNFTLNTAVANWPVALTGFNAALLASNNVTAGSPGATAFDIPNNYCLYQQGLNGSTRGLPGSGVFSSQSDSSTAFQLGPYGAADALILGDTYARSGTLILSNPDALNSLTILAASANGGGQGTFVLNFTNGTTSPVFAFNCQDWFFVITNVAIQGFGRLQLGATLTAQDNGGSNPNMYQTTVNLAALGLAQPIASITFSNRTGAGASESTAIFAISGMPTSIPVQTPTGLAAIPGTNTTVQLLWHASAGATNYNVKQSAVSSSSYVTIGSVSGTSYTVTGLANGSTYYFVVSAVGTANESTNSSPVSAIPGSYLGWAFGVNPVAYWPLNETSGTVAYDLVRGSNGVFAGGCIFTTGGAVGAGFGSPHRLVAYNGSTAYTQIPRLIGSTNFSIVFWVRTGASGGGPNWYSGEGLVDGEVGGTTGDFGVALVGSKVGFGVGNPDTTLPSVKSINDNLWHQVVVTRDADSGLMSIFIDGKFDISATGPTGVRTNPPSLRIGSIQTGTGFFSGSISDVAMYQEVLTTNQIATLYSAATGLFYNVTLTNKISGANLVLSWPGNGKLLEATNLAGPWTTNLSTSPVTVVPNQPQKFFQIQTP
jgi:Concanavalin A-like lectin/glucanases superfamily